MMPFVSANKKTAVNEPRVLREFSELFIENDRKKEEVEFQL
jgi:hypothetical protein